MQVKKAGTRAKQLSPSSEKTVPQVFIIESLRLEDEDEYREGEVISRTLRMARKKPRYEYIRTREELEHFIEVFEDSGYRYLHLSCHGNVKEIGLTFGTVPIAELAEMLQPALIDRRLFLSACLVTTRKLASLILEPDGCFSVAGPVGEMNMDDSAIFWSSFYHMMFREDSHRMKRSGVEKNLTRAANLVDEKIRMFTYGSGGVREKTLPESEKSKKMRSAVRL